MKSSRNLWPLGVALTLVLFFAGTVGLVVLASAEKSELVSDDYYEQELKYQDRIESLNCASRRNLPATVHYDAVRRCVTISMPPTSRKENITGRIQLYRPSTAGLDRQYPLELSADGRQTLQVGDLPRGLWRIRVSWRADGQDCFLDQKLVIEAEEPVEGVNRR